MVPPSPTPASMSMFPSGGKNIETNDLKKNVFLFGGSPTPSPASMSKFPSGGQRYGQKCFFIVLRFFMKT